MSEQKLKVLGTLFAELPETLPISTEVMLCLDHGLVAEKGYWYALERCLERSWGPKDAIGFMITERGSKIDSTLSILEKILPHLTAPDLPLLDLWLDTFIQEARRYTKDRPPTSETACMPKALEVVNGPKGSQNADGEISRTSESPKRNRPYAIDDLISKEVGYVRELELIDVLYLSPVRQASPPVFESLPALQSFLNDVSGCLTPLIATNRTLSEAMKVLKSDDSLTLRRISDILLEAAPELMTCYLRYSAMLPTAEKRVANEIERNHYLRDLLEKRSSEADAYGRDLKTSLNRPMEHLTEYELVLGGITNNEVFTGDPGLDALREAYAFFQSLHASCSLQMWQHAMGFPPRDKLQWHNLLSEGMRAKIDKKEGKRQSIIFELIKGEMEYVRDLENIDKIYLKPLLEANPPIIPRDQVGEFVQTVFHNYLQLLAHHQRLLQCLLDRQAKEHPVLHSVTDLLLEAAQHWHDAYMEYIYNYPFAKLALSSELESNSLFKGFVETCRRHPNANRQDIHHFIHRPIPRVSRYELLLRNIVQESPAGHQDHERVPRVVKAIQALVTESERRLACAERKAELKQYNDKLVFKVGESINLELLDENRSLVHAGKLFGQPDNKGELWVLLFDNYLVTTEQKEHSGITKYHVTRRPMILDLLVVEHFIDPPISHGVALLRPDRSSSGSSIGTHPLDSRGPPVPSSSAANGSRSYPCKFLHRSRLSGGSYVLYAESAVAQAAWGKKLAEAQTLRKATQDAARVFKIETFSINTFFVPPSVDAGTDTISQSHAEERITGRVTCSVQFSTADGRSLVAVGCAKGVWIGFRHGARNMRKVLSLQMVTQCAVLEAYGVFLVLANKSLYAYGVEALLPRGADAVNAAQRPQKLSGDKDIHFFSVGISEQHTFVIYVRKKDMDSTGYVVEPKDRGKHVSRFSLKKSRDDWFTSPRQFVFPGEAYGLTFLPKTVALSCVRGFAIFDLTSFKTLTVPQRNDAKNEKLLKRCDSCQPIGMYKSNSGEYLLCYTEFGLFVDRQGNPLHDKPLIEWEGMAERIAWRPPYILIFTRHYIEIRTMETGRLIQIIHGRDICAIWDGDVTSQSSTVRDPHQGQQRPRGPSSQTGIHGVMEAPPPKSVLGRPSVRPSLVAQHVFELVPVTPHSA